MADMIRYQQKSARAICIFAPKQVNLCNATTQKPYH